MFEFQPFLKRLKKTAFVVPWADSADFLRETKVFRESQHFLSLFFFGTPFKTLKFLDFQGEESDAIKIRSHFGSPQHQKPDPVSASPDPSDGS